MTLSDIEAKDGIISRDDFDRHVLQEGLLPSEAVDLESKFSVEAVKTSWDDDKPYKGDLTTLKLYRKEISKIPLLTPEEERSLSFLVHNAPDEFTRIQARNKLVEHNLQFALWMANRFQSRTSGSFGLEDLIQECNIGLTNAAELYDGSRGTRFCSYAYYCILSSITRSVAEKAYSVRVPALYPTKFNHLKVAQESAAELYGENVPVEEIVRECHRLFPGERISVQNAKEILSLFPSAISLESNLYVGEDDTYERRKEQVVDGKPTAAERMESDTRKQVLLALVDSVLNEREKDVLMARFDLKNDSDEVALRIIGERYSVTPERVRQILHRALGKLGREMERSGFSEMLEEYRLY